MIKILQEQLRIFNSEKQQQELIGLSDSTDQSNDIIALRLQCNWLKKNNEVLKDENQALKNTKQVLEEMLESRDRTLVSLTHEVYDLESKNSRMLTHAELEREFLQDEMPKKIQQKMEQLEVCEEFLLSMFRCFFIKRFLFFIHLGYCYCFRTTK